MSDGLYETLVAQCPVLLDRVEVTPPELAAALVDSLVAAGHLPPERRDEACAAVHEREVSGGSTALACGIAIPHGYLDVPEPLMAVGVHRAGIDCGAIDGSPSHIFILLLSRRETRAHIHILANVNRRLLLPEVREGILQARTPETVRALLLGDRFA